MNYIWDTIIRAKQRGIDIDKIHFKLAQRYSAYMEMSFDSINEIIEEDMEVEINPYYRFYSIFKNMFSVEQEEDEQIKAELFDLCVHLLAKIDVNTGMNQQEFFRLFVEQDIERGVFGKRAAVCWQSFEAREKEFISNHIVFLYKLGQPIYILKNVIGYIFPNSYLYINNIEKKEILVYAGVKKKEVYENKLRFLRTVFLPLGYDMRIYWDKHLGIIGMAETMQIGQIVLY